MKKKLNVDGIANELKGGSAFFPNYQKSGFSPIPTEDTPSPVANTDVLPANPQTRKPINLQTDKDEKDKKKKEINEPTIPRYHDTVTPRRHEPMIPYSEEALSSIRKAVKQIGKESATQRLTLQEKQNLKDIEYSYERLGIRTSGNEIIRIAINYIIQDYQKNGELSILAKVIKDLNS